MSGQMQEMSTPEGSTAGMDELPLYIESSQPADGSPEDGDEVDQVKEANQPDQELAYCMRKCVHKGDRICVSDLISDLFKPDSSTEQGQNGDAPVERSSHSFGTFDSVNSGESAFKIYNFEPKPDDPQMDKCIAFWENLLKHDLQPIKCTMVRPKQASVRSFIPEDLLEKPASEVVEETEQEPKRNPCLDVWNEIKKKKLQELEVVKNNCYVREPPGQYYRKSKKDEAKEIEALNSWVPKGGGGAAESSKSTVEDLIKKQRRISEQRQQQREKHAKLAAAREAVQAEARARAKLEPARKHIKSITQFKRTKPEKKVSEQQSEILHFSLMDSALCRCGCRVEECCCAQHDVTLCDCGCLLADCVCGKLPVICDCGCDQADCICDELNRILAEDDPCACEACDVCVCTPAKPEATPVCPCIVCNESSACLCKEKAVIEEVSAEVDRLFPDQLTGDKCPCGCNLVGCICTAYKASSAAVRGRGSDKETQTEDVEVAVKDRAIRFEVYCPICGEFHQMDDGKCSAFVDREGL